MKELTEMTGVELKSQLDELGVTYKAKAKVADLRKLLEEALDRKGSGVHPANDPICEIFGEPKAGHPACGECMKTLAQRFDACMLFSQESKKSSKASSSAKGPSTKTRGKYKSFEELKENLERAPEERLTMVVDKLLLKGATPQEILAEAEDRRETDFPGNRDFKSINVVKKHIRYRAEKGWIFSTQEDGKIQLTGYSLEPQEVSFTPVSTEKTAD